MVQSYSKGSWKPEFQQVVYQESDNSWLLFIEGKAYDMFPNASLFRFLYISCHRFGRFLIKKMRAWKKCLY